MPLHLLGKKSWNVYNADNIERVKRDEAEAAQKEVADEQRQQQEDIARRIAVLRGELPPARESEHNESTRESVRRSETQLLLSSQPPRKRRRLHGEDETDAEIRHAREAVDLGKQASRTLQSATADSKLVDHAGHIQLIPPPVSDMKESRAVQTTTHRGRAGGPAEDRSKPPSQDTFGTQPATQTPWYSSRPADSADRSHAALDTVNNVNAWGRPDDRRTEREQGRIASNDPLAFMRRAQTKLKRNELAKQKHAGQEADRRVRSRDQQESHEYHGHSRSTRRRSTERSKRADRRHGHEKRRSSNHRRPDDSHHRTHHHRSHRRRSRSPPPR